MYKAQGPFKIPQANKPSKTTLGTWPLLHHGWLTFWLYNNIYIIEVFLFVNKVGVLKKALA